jgi:translocation and assembly module TamA
MFKRLALICMIAACPTLTTAFELKIASNSLEEELQAVSLIATLENSTSPASAQDVVAAAQADYARFVGLLFDRGYFAPTISIRLNNREASEISSVQPPAKISTVYININTGPSFTLGDVSIGPLAPNTEPLGQFAKHQPATTSGLRESVDDAIEDWRAQGHAKASLKAQNIIANHATTSLDADIQLAPGPQLRFGKLRIDGNDRMRMKRIEEIAGLPTGQVFSPKTIDNVATRLRRTGVFSVVSLNESDTIGANNTIAIDAQFVETKPRRFGFGADISTQQGLGFNAYWLHRNLFGGAERLRIAGEISGLGGDSGGEDFELSLSFGRPATFNEDTDLYATAELASVNEPNYSSDRLSLETGIKRYATERREYTLGFGFEAAETSDIFGDQSYRILTLPLSVTFDYRDDKLDATKGYFAQVQFTPFLNISGTASGARTAIDTRAFYSLGPSKRVTLALRGQLGSVIGPDLADAPADFLFYSGGGGTVRGHDFQSLGVDFGGGNVIGGRSFLGLSGEVRVKTGDKLSVVGFYDLGYVGSEAFPDGKTGEWHSGAGVGIRYDTGIGPVRLDVAVPVSGPDNSSSGAEFYIGIGQSF